MLGDTAVAVHPDDERYKHLVGKHAILPLVGRRIPIVADDYSDPEKGTGAVKITPAHDFNDFEVGRRHHLPQINVLDIEGKIDAQEQRGVPGRRRSPELTRRRQALHGLDRFVRAQAIVELLEEQGLLDKIEPHTHMVPHGDRSNVRDRAVPDRPVVRRRQGAELMALAAVREGRTEFVPKNWEKTYFDWMENIQPWCISRQLWWGHQIPAWYGPDDKVFVAETEDEALAEALAYYVVNNVLTQEEADKIAESAEKRATFLKRDEDVLDTWFSSALWPFSTLGWPDETPELERYYPTNALVTGFDIIFFWVARMMMMGLHFMKEVPFRHRLHPRARARREGRQDVEVEGQRHRSARADRPVRRRRAALHAGRDGGAGARHQALDAARRRLSQLRDQAVERGALCRDEQRRAGAGLRSAARDRDAEPWIAARDREGGDARSPRRSRRTGSTRRRAPPIASSGTSTATGISSWPSRCSPGRTARPRTETRAMVAWVRDEMLQAAAPVHAVHHRGTVGVTAAAAARGASRADAHGPRTTGSTTREAEAEIGWVIDLITAIRSVRAEMNVAAATAARAGQRLGGDEGARGALDRTHQAPRARLEVFDLRRSRAAGCGAVVVRGEVAALPLEGVIDVAAERARLEKELAKVDADIKRVDAKLGNADFVRKAPEEIIEGEKEKREEAEGRRAKILEALERLKGAA